jgi:hypothetical protein
MGYEALYTDKQCQRYRTACCLHFQGGLREAKTANLKVETVISSETYIFSYQHIKRYSIREDGNLHLLRHTRIA